MRFCLILLWRRHRSCRSRLRLPKLVHQSECRGVGGIEFERSEKFFSSAGFIAQLTQGDGPVVMDRSGGVQLNGVIEVRNGLLGKSLTKQSFADFKVESCQVHQGIKEFRIERYRNLIRSRCGICVGEFLLHGAKIVPPFCGSGKLREELLKR